MDEVVVAASVVATGRVVAGCPVVVGDAVDVVGTVVVVAVLSGDDVRALRCVLISVFMVVVVTALVGLVVVARVGMGRVEARCTELGWVVVVRAEASRSEARAGVVVGSEILLSDFFRSLPLVTVVVVLGVLLVVVLGVLLFGAPVADLPARYRRPCDPYDL